MRKLTDMDSVRAYVEGRGYSVAEAVNDESSEFPGRIAGLTLVGPRRNRTFLPIEDGLVSLAAAELWCDSVDYATRAVESRRIRR